MKIYGADGGRYGSTRDGVERFWRNVIGGAASARFHRPDSGIGLSPTAKASLAAARKLESLVKMWQVEPRNDLLGDRADNEAYLAADAGRRYALYFPDGGSVSLDLIAAPGEYELRWINIATGEWGPRAAVSGGSRPTIATPGEGGWAAAIVKKP